MGSAGMLGTLDGEALGLEIGWTGRWGISLGATALEEEFIHSFSHSVPIKYNARHSELLMVK